MKLNLSRALFVASLSLSILSYPIISRADEKDQGELVFNGKDLSGWNFVRQKDKDLWSVVGDVKLDPNNHARLIGSGASPGGGAGILFRDGEGDSGGQKGTDIYTEKKFGDCAVHAEFMVPEKSNSGIYLMGQFWSDIGTPDSKLNVHNTGAVYSTKPPTTIALKPYGEWNTYDIVFRAPRFDANGKKIQNARVMSVVLNGVKVQPEPVDTPKPTGGTLKGNAEAPTGPLMLQGNHGPVAMRNIRVKPLKLKD
jgi:hypothetical protein